VENYPLNTYSWQMTREKFAGISRCPYDPAADPGTGVSGATSRNDFVQLLQQRVFYPSSKPVAGSKAIRKEVLAA